MLSTTLPCLPLRHATRWVGGLAVMRLAAHPAAMQGLGTPVFALALVRRGF